MRTASLFCCLVVAASGAAQNNQSVFRQPFVMANYTRMTAQTLAALQEKDYPAAQKAAEQAIAFAPHYPDAYYNLACALASQG
jgi:Tfp pilus assembly protein PilF